MLGVPVIPSQVSVTGTASAQTTTLSPRSPVITLWYMLAVTVVSSAQPMSSLMVKATNFNSGFNVGPSQVNVLAGFCSNISAPSPKSQTYETNPDGAVKLIG